MKCIVMTTGRRNIAALRTALPDVVVVPDATGNAMDTFKKALAIAGYDAYVHFEDDVILCNDFAHKAQSEIDKRPGSVIQFFSRRAEDTTAGSRYIAGGSFVYNVGVYFPPGFARGVLEYAKMWPSLIKHPTGLDNVVADYMKENKMRYWNVVPNLVDHAIGESLIDRRRPRNRSSLTFGKG